VEPLRLADLSVDPERRQVRRGARSVALTAREYQLLLLLLRKRDSIVSREQILREIWEDQPRAASNVIEVYVRYLRRKLEEGGERRLIHTVRGLGYSLAATPPGRDDGGALGSEVAKPDDEH
jgi:DNA-binding response OmpR family regulator